MTDETDIKAELADHIPNQAGNPTPDGPNETIEDTPLGGADEIPPGIVGEVVLRRLVNSQGDTIGWETIKPAALAEQIDKVDRADNDVSESDVFSDDYLTQWRDEGRGI